MSSQPELSLSINWRDGLKDPLIEVTGTISSPVFFVLNLDENDNIVSELDLSMTHTDNITEIIQACDFVIKNDYSVSLDRCDQSMIRLITNKSDLSM
jgi:hypothetical protein